MDPLEYYSEYNEDSNTRDHVQVSELQKLCLRQILQNFDRLCAAFKMPNSKVPKKHWELLGRLYSEKMLEQLKKAKQLKGEHFDLLISPHMKKLDIEGMDKKILPDLAQVLKKHGANILSFKGQCQDTVEDICTSLMSALPNVEEIDYLHDECFSGLETMTLKEKIFRVGKRSDSKRFAQIPQICKAIGQNCGSLKSLTFKYYDECSIRKHNTGMAFILKNCPFLETLQYIDTVGALYELHKRDLPLLKLCKKRSPKTNVKYNLKNLFSQNRFRRYYPLLDALAICAATCPCVSRLYIEFLDRDEELEMISRFTQLQDIKFEIIGVISSSCLGKFLDLRGNRLISLEMPYNSGLPIQTLIESCPKLQSLILSHVQIPEHKGTSEQACKGSIPDLKNVEFLHTNFGVPGAVAALKMILSAAKNTEKLSLRGSYGLTHQFLRSLDLSSIRFLDASISDIKVDSLTEMVLHGSVKTLQIYFCDFLSCHDYFNLSRCVILNNKNVHVKYHLLQRSSWRNLIRCSITDIP